jgi:iron(III) transport system permease protein
MTTLVTPARDTGVTPSASAPTRRRTRRREISIRVALVICFGFVLVGSVYPTVAVLSTGLSADALPRYLDFITSPLQLRTLRNTIVLGLLVGAIGTAIAFLFAFVQTRLAVPLKRVLHVIALIPIVSPPFAVATATIVLYGRSGVITHDLLGLEYDIYGLDGLVFVLSLSLFPVGYLGLLGMMRALDPAVEESAMILGASRWQIFRTVQLPLLAPGLVAPFLLLFVEAIADLANPLVLGGDYSVLASQAYIAVNGNYDLPGAAVYSIILLVPALGLYVMQRYWLSRKVRTTVSGKPSGSVHLIHSWVRWPIYGAAWLVALVIVSLYGTVVCGAFVRLFGVNNTLTLDHFRYVFTRGREALVDTTTLALIATPIAGALGMVMAWLIVRHLGRLGAALDFAGMLGIAVPGTVLGIGYLLAYRLGLYVGPVQVMPALVGGSTIAGGAIAIILAYVTRSVPGGLRTATASLSQVDRTIEEASTSLGAKPLQTFRWVTLPLIRPSLLAGLSYGFARCMTSISTIVLLVTPQTRIITAQILSAADSGRYGIAFAYCTVLIAIVLAVFGLIRLVVGGAPPLQRIAETTGRRKS